MNSNYWHYHLAVLTLVAALTHATHERVLARDESRPNVLFIAVDDLKPTIGAYGDRMAITPNMDRLAQSGTVFMNNHCQQAVCGASRTSIMTGLRPDTTRVWVFGPKMRELRPNTVTIPQHFKDHGYETTAIGKIFDPRNVNDKFDPESWSIPHKSWVDFRFHPDYKKPSNAHYHNPKSVKAYKEARAKGLRGYHDIFKFMKELEANPPVECLDEDQPDNTYADGAIALAAIALLEELNQSEKPFFLGVGFAKPHLPFVAPKKYWDLYKREEIAVHPFQSKTSSPVDQAYHDCSELKGYGGIPSSLDSYSNDSSDHLSENAQRELIHGYYASTSFVDAQVGKLLDSLKELGIADNTIVVLWGDHGFHLGDHGLWHKQTNFEQATRSPLIISAPGIAGNVVASSPTEFIDVFPTLCELAGLPTLSVLEGENLVGLMKGMVDEVKPFAVSQYPRGESMGYSIRTKGYRYTEWIRDWRTFNPYSSDRVQGRELYDYGTDPYETKNRVDEAEYEDILADLQEQLHTFFEQQRQNHAAVKSSASSTVPGGHTASANP